MKYILCFVLALLYRGHTTAQSLQRPTFSNGGNNSNQVTATVGEPMAAFKKATAGSLSIGAQPGDAGVVATQSPGFLPNIAVFPNPTPGLLNIDLPAATADYHLSLYSTDGKLVIEKNQTTGLNTLDCSLLPAGVYLLQVIRGNQMATFKVTRH